MLNSSSRQNADLLPLSVYGDAPRIARIFYWFTASILVSLLGGILIVLISQDTLYAAILAIGLLPIPTIVLLIRRHKFEQAAIFLALLVLVLITLLATTGLGVHQISNLGYPVILIVASTVTRRRTMVILTLCAVGCVAWLVFGELAGVYVPKTLVHSVPGDFFSASLAIVVTAFMVRLMAETLFQNTRRLMREIAERNRAEAALRELNATLEQRVADRTADLQAANLRLTELDHLKDEFLSRISHELRTPLASVKIYVELLETGRLDKRDNYLQTLKREVEKLRALIEDVLLFSQLNLYTQPSALESSDLNNLIEGRLTTWQKLSVGRALQFKLALTQGLPAIQTDGELVMQALTRLIANAVNYTPAGAVIVSTAPRDQDDRCWVTIGVQDTGPGITPEDLPHIFERFYRGRAAADYKTPGAGVGLSISREIVERLGGCLTVETQVGVGSTFTIWLPVVLG